MCHRGADLRDDGLTALFLLGVFHKTATSLISTYLVIVRHVLRPSGDEVLRQTILYKFTG